MPRKRLPYIHRQVTRHARTVWYFRRGKGPRTRLHAKYGTPEFMAEYEAALAGIEFRQSQMVKTGTLRWLFDRYRETTEWTELSWSTRKQRENIFLHVMESGGDKPYGSITAKHIEEGKNRRRDTPAQARNFLDAMRGLFRWALRAGHVRMDPTAAVRNPKRRDTEGFKAWLMEDVERYEALWPEGTRQRVWLHVLLYVGCRRGDAVVIGRQHLRDGVLTFTTEKGRDRKRIEVTRRVEPELAATLALGPCGDLAFISGERGQPLTKESFGNMFKAACVEAGIRDKSAHGLRKLAATMWAERGASEHELMAMFGWVTPQMAALYTRSVHRRKLALNAHDRLAGTAGEHSIPSPTREVREPAQKK